MILKWSLEYKFGIIDTKVIIGTEASRYVGKSSRCGLPKRYRNKLSTDTKSRTFCKTEVNLINN